MSCAQHKWKSLQLLSCNVLCLGSTYLSAPRPGEFHELWGQHQWGQGRLSLASTMPVCVDKFLFNMKVGGYVGNFVHPAKDKYMYVHICWCENVECVKMFGCVCVILAVHPSPHSFPLIPSACQAVSQSLCAPQIRRRPFVVRWWRFLSEEGIWLCII